MISGSWGFGGLSVRAEEVQTRAGVHGDRLCIVNDVIKVHKLKRRP
jgi:hypothetical protein